MFGIYFEMIITIYQTIPLKALTIETYNVKY